MFVWVVSIGRRRIFHAAILEEITQTGFRISGRLESNFMRGLLTFSASQLFVLVLRKSCGEANSQNNSTTV
jgi:hypothetical protein